MDTGTIAEGENFAVHHTLVIDVYEIETLS
jgi:hypothetical protein